jgi:stage II sporulation protein D
VNRRGFLVTSGLLVLGCATGARTRGGARRRAAGPAPLPTTEPVVRIGIGLGSPWTSFQPVGGNYLVGEELAQRPIAVAADGESWELVAGGVAELRVIEPGGHLSQPRVRPVRIQPLAERTALEVAGRRYAGTLEVLPGPDGLTLVNELPLEEYLRGVLPAELPAGEDALEALKAQAVAARTYTLKRLGSRAVLGFDLFGDVQDQSYAGVGAATAAADRALADTRGEVLLAGGHVVDAYYHSTCGGSTAALEEAFPLPPLPYLMSVEDHDRDGSFYCARSRYFRWQATYTRSDLERLFARNLGSFVTLPTAGLGGVTDLSIVETSAAGRVLALRIETSNGNFQVARNDVRWIFADDSSPGLRSTLFLLRKERRRGAVESVTLTGGGWGHGVGMCQMGALGRAAAGASHAEILSHYYTRTAIERLYA